MNTVKVLIIEDDSLYRKALRKQLSSFDVTEAASLDEALDFIQKTVFHLAVLDLSLDKKGEGQGLSIISQLIEKNIYVVVMTGSKNKSIVEKAYDLGCHEYFVKGDEETAIRTIMEKYLTNGKNHWVNDFFEKDFLTLSNNQRELISRAFPLFETDISIFINGETGSGKTHLARAIHKYSKRAGELIEINCANLSEGLMESELFGHEKGAFTGATDKKVGILEKANNGTVFLDEVSSLNMSTQAKLLKAIEEKKFFPLGSSKTIKSDFRILSACYNDISTLISENKFRKDLYHRIAALSIYILPIKERKEDIIPLIENYCGFKKISFTKEAKDHLLQYEWSGNTREILNFTKVLLSTNSGRITKEAVDKILSSNLKITDSSVITQTMINLARQLGLNPLLNFIESEITKRIQEKDNASIREVQKILKISGRQYYRAMEHISTINKTSETNEYLQ